MLDILKAGTPKVISYLLDFSIFIEYFSFLVNYVSVLADYLVICIKSWGHFE